MEQLVGWVGNPQVGVLEGGESSGRCLRFMKMSEWMLSNGASVIQHHIGFYTSTDPIFSRTQLNNPTSVLLWWHLTTVTTFTLTFPCCWVSPHQRQAVADTALPHGASWTSENVRSETRFVPPSYTCSYTAHQDFTWSKLCPRMSVLYPCTHGILDKNMHVGQPPTRTKISVLVICEFSPLHIYINTSLFKHGNFHEGIYKYTIYKILLIQV